MTTSTLSRAEYQKAYREANPEKILGLAKAYREANLEKILASQRAYRKVNREKAIFAQKKYHKVNLQATIIDSMARKCKSSALEIRALVPQELLEVKLLQLQLHRLIHARA